MLKSNWPRIEQLTEAHHEEPPGEWISPWALRRAEQMAARTHANADEETFTQYCEALASHLADHSAARRHAYGVCITNGCSNFAASEYALRCAEHQPTGDMELPKPYGMDDATSVSAYQDWLGGASWDYEAEEDVIWYADWRKRRARKYRVNSPANEITSITNWDDDSHTISR